MKNLILNNFGMKASAVLISVFLWFFVTSRGQSELSLDAPLEFKDIPLELGIVSSSAKSVTLTVRGQERFMKNLNAADIRVFVDLSKAKQGDWIFPIDKDNVKLPFAMSATNVAPSSVKVKLEEIISKKVAVRPQVIGISDKGAQVSIAVEPKRIAIKGLKSDIQKVDALRTEVLNISDMHDSVTEELALETSGMNITPEVAKVKVTITFMENKK